MQTVTINDNHVLLYVCVLMEKKDRVQLHSMSFKSFNHSGLVPTPGTDLAGKATFLRQPSQAGSHHPSRAEGGPRSLPRNSIFFTTFRLQSRRGRFTYLPNLPATHPTINPTNQQPNQPTNHSSNRMNRYVNRLHELQTDEELVVSVPAYQR